MIAKYIVHYTPHMYPRNAGKCHRLAEMMMWIFCLHRRMNQKFKLLSWFSPVTAVATADMDDDDDDDDDAAAAAPPTPTSGIAPIFVFPSSPPFSTAALLLFLKSSFCSSSRSRFGRYFGSRSPICRADYRQHLHLMKQ